MQYPWLVKTKIRNGSSTRQAFSSQRNSSIDPTSVRIVAVTMEPTVVPVTALDSRREAATGLAKMGMMMKEMKIIFCSLKNAKPDSKIRSHAPKIKQMVKSIEALEILLKETSKHHGMMQFQARWSSKQKALENQERKIHTSLLGAAAVSPEKGKEKGEVESAMDALRKTEKSLGKRKVELLRLSERKRQKTIEKHSLLKLATEPEDGKVFTLREAVKNLAEAGYSRIVGESVTKFHAECMETKPPMILCSRKSLDRAVRKYREENIQ